MLHNALYAAMGERYDQLRAFLQKRLDQTGMQQIVIYDQTEKSDAEGWTTIIITVALAPLLEGGHAGTAAEAVRRYDHVQMRWTCKVEEGQKREASGEL